MAAAAAISGRGTRWSSRSWAVERTGGNTYRTFRGNDAEKAEVFLRKQRTRG
jgi:hypothetical protein